MFPAMHSKEFQCPICAKHFSRKFTLDAHLLIHKGEKPFTCQFCGKSFRQKGTLMRHKALHSTKNLFHCSLCNQGFRQKNVFIFHLRHRHNVSTETLDRRKYRTEPKDYQSIMDTLPPFVHADSAAIVASGEHFDAILSESMQRAVEDSHVLQCDYTDGNQMLDAHNGLESASVGGMKPSVSTGIFPTNTMKPFHMNDVSSSDDANSEEITCIPCQLSFTSEIDFKYHMQTHVQSVLFADGKAEAQKLPEVSSVLCETPGSSSSLPVSNPFVESKSLNNTVAIPDSQSTCDKLNLPVKTEVLDSETDAFSPQCTNNLQTTANSPSHCQNESSSQQRFKCSICDIYFHGNSAFKKHSNQHDPQMLLKVIEDLLGKKSNLSINSCSKNNFLFDSNARTGSRSHNNFNKKAQQKLQNADSCKKSVVQTKSLLPKRKSLLKLFACVLCNKKFPNKFLLEYHRQLHLNTKGFSCCCCKNSFSSKKSLLSHTRLHHMKVFTCSTCSRVFNYHRLYDSHQKQCGKCANAVTSNGSCINFPVVDIELLLKSDMSDIIGIIPVSTESSEKKKFGIPVMSVSQIKALCNT